MESKLFVTNLAVGGGLCVLDLETELQSKMLPRTDASTPHGLAAVDSTIFFSDTKSRQIKYFCFPVDPAQLDVKVYARNKDAARKYGLAKASFGQPSSIVAKGNPLIVFDMGVNAIYLVSSIKPLYVASHQFSALYDGFGVHSNKHALQQASESTCQVP